MWILIIVTLSFGITTGAVSVKEIRFNNEVPCLKAAENLQKIYVQPQYWQTSPKEGAVKAFCIKDSK